MWVGVVFSGRGGGCIFVPSKGKGERVAERRDTASSMLGACQPPACIGLLPCRAA